MGSQESAISEESSDNGSAADGVRPMPSTEAEAVARIAKDTGQTEDEVRETLKPYGPGRTVAIACLPARSVSAVIVGIAEGAISPQRADGLLSHWRIKKPSDSAGRDGPRRGRPRLMSPALEAEVRDLTDARTPRGQQDTYYRQRCLSVLRGPFRDDERLRWLADLDRMAAGGPGAWRPSILTELGRHEDPDTMYGEALMVCKLKPKARDAIALLRQRRLGRAPEPDVEDLLWRLLETVRRYRVGHPTTTPDQVVSALEVAAVAARESMREEG